ncbi:MAG: GAF domain-containing protein [Actinomycetota bacterium]
MIEAEVPDDEAARLSALADYRLLDTEPEADLDAITTLAARVAGTPVSLVSLVDADRQWFKSRHGLEATETPRNVSFCAHTILQDEPLVVPDATRDVRFADNPLVHDGLVRSYAGVPLRSHTGHALGTLCVIDRRARRLGEETLDSLTALAGQAQSLLRYRYHELSGLAVVEARHARLDAFDRELHATFDGIVGAHHLLASTPLTGEQFNYLEIGQHAADHLAYLIDHLAGVLDRPSTP